MALPLSPIFPSTDTEDLYLQQAVVFIEDAIQVSTTNFLTPHNKSTHKLQYLGENCSTNMSLYELCVCKPSVLVSFFFSTDPSTIAWTPDPSTSIDGTTPGYASGEVTPEENRIESTYHFL